MKKHLKSALAMLLSLLVVVSGFIFPGAAVHAADATQLPPRTLFEDDCNADTIASAWTVAGGTATADGEKYTFTKGTMYLPYNQGMQDYTVQADVSIPDTTADQGIFTSTGLATIAVRYDHAANSGYEFGLIAAKDSVDNAKVRLYARNGATTLNKSYSIAGALYEGDTSMALPGNEYILKIKVSGTRLMGYVNDVLVFDITDTNFTHGTVALRAQNCIATFDNVKITADEFLYTDDFSQATTTKQRGWSADRTVENGEMILINGRAYLSGFAYTQNWSNYAVEVDLHKEYIENDATAQGAFVGIAIGTRGTKRSGIEFTIIDYSAEDGWKGDFQKQEIRFYNCNTQKVLTGSPKLTAEYNPNTETVEEAWAERPYKPENGLTMRVEVINYGTNGKIIGYIDGKEVLSAVVDDPNDLIGAPGVVSSTGHVSYFDNFKVYNRLNYVSGITDIQLQDKDGNSVNTLSLYRGFEIETIYYQLQATYGDGSVKQIPLATEWIDYGDEGLQPGQNQVVITYEGAEFTLPVTVSERPEYVAAFQTKLAALNPATLTTKNATAVAELKAYFDTLSPYEVESLSQTERDKYKNLIVKMDQLTITEAKGQALLFYDDISTMGIDQEKWNTSKSNAAKYRWFARNGYLINDQQAYGNSGESWMLAEGFNGSVSAAEVDITLNQPAVFGSLVFNYDGSSYYHARITNRYTDYRVELYKNTDSQKYLGAANFSNLGLTGQDGVSNTLRVTQVGSVIKVYVNGVLAVSYTDQDPLYYGDVGFRNLYGAAFYDNLRVYGDATVAAPNLPKDIAPTDYTDDFEDETAGQSPSHWIEDYNYNTNEIIDDWQVYNQNGNKVYGTTATTATYTWLHGFDQNPEYSAKFMYSGSGKTGFVTRLFDELSWLVIGYDTAKQTWFTAANECAAQEPTQVIWAKTATPLAADTWHTVSIVLNGTKATLVVNGQTVMQINNAACDSYGRVGVFSQGPQTYVDDVYVKSASGTTFVDGVVDYSMTDGTVRTGSYLEIEDLGNGHLVGVTSTKQFHSYDNGETWTDVTGTDAAYDIAAGGMGYTSILNLGDGNWVQVRVPWDNAHSLVSHDNMKTWTKTAEYIGQDEYVDEYGNKSIACIHVNSLAKVTVNGKTRILWPLTFRRLDEAGEVLGHFTRFFYSDDGGYTWTESQNDTRDVLPGYSEDKSSTTAEGKFVQCADGSIRYYQTRNGYGNMMYFESKDGGESWTDFGTVPYMQCPKGSFSVTEDIYNPGTYYLTWVHCNPVNLGAIQSRVRISLARSTNGKDWEFLCDVERTSIHSNEGSSFVRQFLDPSITVNQDYVYVTYGRSSISQLDEYHNNQIPRYVRFEKDKLSARPWDDATISDSNFASYMEFAVAPQTKFALNEAFTLEGGIVREVSLNGVAKERRVESYTVVSSLPDTSKTGIYTVTLANDNMNLLSYQVYVGTAYDITWSIQGAGTVQGRVDTVLKGQGFTFTLLPDEGYEIGSVTVNGTAVEPVDGAVTVKNIQKATAIAIQFTKIPVYTVTWDIQGQGTVQGRVDALVRGEGFTFTLLPDEGYEIGSVTVNGTAVELQENAYTVENIQKDTAIAIQFTKIPTYIAGDLNDDGKVTDADAVHLLMHTFFPDTYPVNQPVDYNGDGKITDADAVHLLMYTFFPDTYPIN